MSILTILVVSILIGWLAKSWKGRRAILWFILSLIFISGFAYFAHFSVNTGTPGFTDEISGKMVWLLLSNGIGGVVMLIVIALLPKKKNAIGTKE